MPKIEGVLSVKHHGCQLSVMAEEEAMFVGHGCLKGGSGSRKAEVDSVAFSLFLFLFSFCRRQHKS